MSLRSKIAFVLLVAVALFAGVDLLLRRLNFEARFHELDEADARERLGLMTAAFDEKIADLDRAAEVLDSFLGDEGVWQDVGAPDPGILPRTAAGEPLHLVLVHDAQGWVRLHRVLDPRTDRTVSLRQLPNERLPPPDPPKSGGESGLQVIDVAGGHPLMREGLDGRAPRGLWITDRGALLVSARELESSSPTPLRLTVGRFFDESLLAELRYLSGLELEAIQVQGHLLNAHEQEILARIAATSGPVVDVVDEGVQRAWTVVADLNESPALLLRVDLPRNLALLWSELSSYTLTSALAVITLFPLVLLQLLQWIVTGPLRRLTAHAVAIGQANDSDARLDLRRTDEIGQLAEEFDRMLEKLAHSRAEVVSNARLAGMSEVSAGVIHNVGNMLNSVKISAGMTRRQVTALNLKHLRVIQSELEAHAGDLDAYLANHPRGKHLMRFFAALLDKFEASTLIAHAEAQTLGEGIEQIETLIRSLDSFDPRHGLVERLFLSEQLDAATELCQRSLHRGLVVQVERHYDDLPPLNIDRHKLMEILVNLVRNALEALEAARVEPRRLTLRLEREGDEAVRIEVVDNGVGIPLHDLVQVFALGYTTKPDGRGLGLHLAATTAAEMGGSLSVDSDGPGRGATFSLRLPLNLAAPAAAASS